MESTASWSVLDGAKFVESGCLCSFQVVETRELGDLLKRDGMGVLVWLVWLRASSRWERERARGTSGEERRRRLLVGDEGVSGGRE